MTKYIIILFALLLLILISGCIQQAAPVKNNTEPSVPPVKEPPATEPPAHGRTFCGTSTNGPCTDDSGCKRGGCSGQVCQSSKEGSVITTCEYLECYDPGIYNLSCKCISNKCQWA